MSLDHGARRGAFANTLSNGFSGSLYETPAVAHQVAPGLLSSGYGCFEGDGDVNVFGEASSIAEFAGNNDAAALGAAQQVAKDATVSIGAAGSKGQDKLA